MSGNLPRVSFSSGLLFLVVVNVNKNDVALTAAGFTLNEALGLTGSWTE